ncbi:hypothetical protein RvY_05768 [Ramazzottius varieornatus]|uniref:Uncharacterized protein n=1 Tax=Ramazzottius varieornatus TaxID=947166 RepID=A0A1D1UZT6_RAMVA|nr:hypothetical protein RvY_05768 [Ramazzottius varieornatus]
MLVTMMVPVNMKSNFGTMGLPALYCTTKPYKQKRRQSCGVIEQTTIAKAGKKSALKVPSSIIETAQSRPRRRCVSEPPKLAIIAETCEEEPETDSEDRKLRPLIYRKFSRTDLIKSPPGAMLDDLAPCIEGTPKVTVTGRLDEREALLKDAVGAKSQEAPAKHLSRSEEEGIAVNLANSSFEDGEHPRKGSWSSKCFLARAGRRIGDMVRKRRSSISYQKCCGKTHG